MNNLDKKKAFLQVCSDMNTFLNEWKVARFFSKFFRLAQKVCFKMSLQVKFHDKWILIYFTKLFCRGSNPIVYSLWVDKKCHKAKQ